MAIGTLDNASLTVNSVDLSDHGNSVALNLGQDAVEITAFSDTFHVHTGGLKSADLQITFYGDLAASSVEQTLNTIFAAGVGVTVIIKADSGATSSTNPSFTYDFLLESYPAITGGPGETQSIDTTWKLTSASPGRATS